MSQPAKTRGPLWLRAVYRLERTIGEPVEAALHSDAYFELVTELMRARARTGRTLEWGSRRVLHLLNLPAGSDIRRLREQLGRMERGLAELGRELEQPTAAPPPGSRRSPG